MKMIKTALIYCNISGCHTCDIHVQIYPTIVVLVANVYFFYEISCTYTRFAFKGHGCTSLFS